MGLVLGLLLGLVVGAAVIYFVMAPQISAQSKALQGLQRKLAQAEDEHDRRLKVATDRLKQDYEAQLQTAQATTQDLQTKLAEAETESDRRLKAETDRLRREYEAQLQAAQSVRPAEPLISPVPEISTPPETAAPTPTIPPPPEPIASTSGVVPPQQQPIPSPISSPAVPGPAVPSSSTPDPTALSTPSASPARDLSALMADSYAPEVEKRCRVALEVAAVLPTVSAADQARWMPLLGRLARDSEAEVRLQIIQALSGLKAAQSLPLLRRALRDPDPFVVEAATIAMARFKGRPQPQPSNRKQRLPKNR